MIHKHIRTLILALALASFPTALLSNVVTTWGPTVASGFTRPAGTRKNILSLPVHPVCQLFQRTKS